MAKKAVNELFDVGEIAKQIQTVLSGVREVTQSLENLKKVTGDIKLAKDAATLTKNIEAQNQAIAKTATLRAKQQQEEAKLALIMARTAQVQNQSNKSLTEAERLVKVYDEAMKRLAGTQTIQADMAMEAKLQLAEANKVLKEQAKAVLGLSGPYDKLQAEFIAASKEAKNLGVSLGTTSQEFKDASAKAIELNNRLKAIDAGIGNHQRNVGNYADGFRNFNLVLRETPNFAISATTGIQSLSNNLPMLGDEIKKMRSEGKSWGEIMKGMAANLFSFGGVVTLITLAITGLPKILKALETQSEKVTEKLKSFAEITRLSQIAVAGELTELKALLVVTNSYGISMEKKSAAVKKINDMLPDYLGNVQLEKDGTIQNTAAIEEYIKVLAKQAKAEAFIAELKNLNVRRITKQNETNKEQVEWYDKLMTYAFAWTTSMKASDIIESKGLMLKKESIDVIKATTEATEKSFNAALQSGEAELKLDKTLREEKIKSGKEIKEKYYDRLLDAQITGLEQEVEVLKSIRDTETNSYAVRLAAGQKFYEATLKLEALKLQDKLKSITFAEKEDVKTKGLSEKEKSDIHKNAEQERLKITNDSRTANVKAEMAHIATIDDLRKKMQADELKRKTDALNQEAQAEEDAIRANEQKLQDQIYRNDEQLYRSLDMLNRDYLNGQFVSYEDFEKAKNLLIAQYSIKNTEVAIAATEELLRNSDLSYKKRAKYEMQLAKLKKELLDGVIKYDNKTNKDSQKELLKTLQTVDSMVKNISSAIAELNSIGYDAKKQALDDEKTLIERNSAAELKRIQDSTLTSQQQADQVILLEAKKQAQLEANDAKRRKLETEHAKFQRLNSIAGIISGTALGVAGALAQTVTLGPFAIALAATVGALGAAQLIKALSSPIPKYKMGTNHHKGGPAIVGDGGKAERVILPSGEQFDTPTKSTLVHLPVGTKVLPDAKALDRSLRVRAISDNGKVQDSKELVMWQTREITKALAKNKPKVNTKVNVNLGKDLWIFKNIYE